MPANTRAARLDAGPEAVWSVLADYGGIGSWSSDVDHSTMISGLAAGVGARRRIQVGRLTIIERVTEWGPESTLAYDIEGLPLPKAIRAVVNRWVLVGAGDTTVVEITTTVDTGSSRLAGGLGRAIARRLARTSDHMLDDLAAVVATGSAG